MIKSKTAKAYGKNGLHYFDWADLSPAERRALILRIPGVSLRQPIDEEQEQAGNDGLPWLGEKGNLLTIEDVCKLLELGAGAVYEHLRRRKVYPVAHFVEPNRPPFNLYRHEDIEPLKEQRVIPPGYMPGFEITQKYQCSIKQLKYKVGKQVIAATQRILPSGKLGYCFKESDVASYFPPRGEQ